MAVAKRKKRQLKATSTKKPAKVLVNETKPQKKGLISMLLGPFKILKFLVPSYFKNSFKELKQVTWPGRRETIKLTFAVFMFAIGFGALITVTDYGLDQLFKKVLLK
ncbi:MAG TPA: preprotein translocase subunit SecE [Candidatus Saccharimonadales bacterium]|nr:preprotein translocase subunit SecE [Candidatus Saccharimonadales bacterium]